MFIRGYEWREIFLYLCRVSVCIKFWVMLIQSMSFVLYLEWIFSRLLKRFIQVWMNHLLINPKALVTVHWPIGEWQRDVWFCSERLEMFRGFRFHAIWLVPRLKRRPQLIFSIPWDIHAAWFLLLQNWNAYRNLKSEINSRKKKEWASDILEKKSQKG